MIDALVTEEIFNDVNFLKLAADKTEIEEFTQLLDEHVRGYSQKKRLSDGMKEFTKKVEDAENRLIVARNVGKFKEPDPEDKQLTSNHSAFELKQKLQTLTVQIQAMIDDSEITHAEKPQVLDNLRGRLAKAKEGGKAKLEEKLDKMITSVIKADSFALPVTNLEQFHQLDKEIQAIEKLEKLPSRNQTPQIRKRIETKADVQADFDALVENSHMWFETVIEFKPRLHVAMASYAANEEERKRREEDEEFEKKLKEEEEALERKRLEAAKHEQEKAKALEEKLQAKRLEAEAKEKEAPKKQEPPKKQPKEKKVVNQLDLREMFHVEQDYETVDAATIQAELDADRKQREWAAALYELQQARQAAEAEKKVRDANKPEPVVADAKPKPKQKPATKPALPAKVSAWAEPEKRAKSEKEIEKEKQQKAEEEEAKFRAVEEKLAAKRLEAESKPQKEQAAKPEPKKKEKKAVKMSLLDFYDEDLVLEKLAHQEAQEKVERAAREEEERKEAERLAAEEDAAWAAEEAAWTAPATTTATERPITAPSVVTPAATEKKAESAPKPAAPKPKPKRVPVEIESKWGAPVAAAVPAEFAAILQDDEDAEVALPSLAEAMAAAPVKKTPPPQPKKKEKKKWGKVDASLIGFDDGNPNVYC